MNTLELASDFTKLLQGNQHEAAAEKYNAEEIVSYEAMEGPMAVCKGKAAVKQKSDWWYANHEVHKVTTEGPFVNGDEFALYFSLDVTPKGGQRIAMEEIGVYSVKNGKIVSERFFYTQD